MICCIPEALNVEELLIRFPPEAIDGFNIDHLLYLLNLVSEIAALDKRLELKSDFVPIRAATVQRIIKNYIQYFRYLVSAGVLESDGHYLPGQKCKGYRFTRKYKGRLCTVELADKKLLKKLKPISVPLSTQRKYGHLLKWFGPGLTIRYELALDYLSEDLERKTKYYGLRDWDRGRTRLKNPVAQYNHSRVAVEKVHAAAFRISFDNKGGRLHSILSNLKSSLRNCLLYNGLEMVSIDICNSQPYLILLLLDINFWQQDPSYNRLHINQLCNSSKSNNKHSLANYSSIFLSVPSYIMISEIKEMQARSGFETYKDIVRNGQFYEHMEGLVCKKMGTSKLGRKHVKAMLFQVLFTSNRYIGQADAEPKRIFKDLFPDVFKLLSIMKKQGKELLPILLQRIESHLVLEVITKRIAKETPHLPLFTIHDSIITTAGNEKYVRRIMLEELERAVGVSPVLRLERWSTDNLRFGGWDCVYP